MQRRDRMLELVHREFADLAAAGQIVVRQRGCPHQRRTRFVVVGVCDGNTASLAHRYEQSFGNALAQIALVLTGHVALERVHHDVNDAAAGLELGYRKGVFRVQERNERTNGLGGDALLDPGGDEIVGNNVRVRHLTASCRDGQNDTNREHFAALGMGAGGRILPRVVTGHKSNTNRLGRVDDTAAADSQNKVNLFRTAKLNALVNKG